MRDRDGQLIVELPEKKVPFTRTIDLHSNRGKLTVELALLQIVFENLEFSQSERLLYDTLYKRTKKRFDEFDRAGLVGKNYGRILSVVSLSSSLVISR